MNFQTIKTWDRVAHLSISFPSRLSNIDIHCRPLYIIIYIQYVLFLLLLTP